MKNYFVLLAIFILLFSNVIAASDKKKDSSRPCLILSHSFSPAARPNNSSLQVKLKNPRDAFLLIYRENDNPLGELMDILESIMFSSEQEYRQSYEQMINQAFFKKFQRLENKGQESKLSPVELTFFKSQLVIYALSKMSSVKEENLHEKFLAGIKHNMFDFIGDEDPQAAMVAYDKIIIAKLIEDPANKSQYINDYLRIKYFSPTRGLKFSILRVKDLFVDPEYQGHFYEYMLSYISENKFDQEMSDLFYIIMQTEGIPQAQTPWLKYWSQRADNMSDDDYLFFWLRQATLSELSDFRVADLALKFFNNDRDYRSKILTLVELYKTQEGYADFYQVFLRVLHKLNEKTEGDNAGLEMLIPRPIRNADILEFPKK